MKALVKCMAVTVLAFSVACSDSSLPEQNEQISFLRELGGDASDFERACESRQFEFPADHLAHPGFRNEWWYLTGNLQDGKGARFGYQVTLFRIANSARELAVESAWSTQQFYMGHFAITAQAAESISAHERFSRAAAGLAGSAAEPVRVWLEDWQLRQNEKDPAKWTLQVAQDSDRLALQLRQSKPLVLHGDEGLSRKSDDPCNSSYYYSLSRLATTGELVVDGETYQVVGSSWLDREWSSSALSDDQAGWDWFALQLRDGRDFMYYRLRSKTGQTDEHSYAVLIDADGEKVELDARAINHRVTKWWQSDGGARYPIAGELEIPGAGLGRIYYEPLIENQELLLTVRYWEGAIVLRDYAGAQTGVGYLELTGY